MFRTSALVFLLTAGWSSAVAAQDDSQVPISPTVRKALTENDYATARRLIGGEVEACVALSPDERRCILVLTAYAMAAAGQPELEARVKRAIDAAERNFGPGSFAAAIVLGSVAPSVMMAGHGAAAEAMLDRAILIRTGLFGASHPTVIDLRVQLASVLVSQGKAKEAVDAAETVLADAGRSEAVTPERLAVLKLSVGYIIGAFDRDRGKALATEAVAVLAETRPAADPDLIEAQFKLAQVQTEKSAGRMIAHRALANARNAGLPPPTMATYLLRTAQFEREGGAYAKSLALVREAEAILADRPEMAVTLIAVLQERMLAYMALKRYDLAKVAMLESSALIAKTMGGDGFAAHLFKLYEMAIRQELREYREIDRMFDRTTLAFWNWVPRSDPSRAIAFGVLGNAKLYLGELAAARVWLRHAGESALDATANRSGFDAAALAHMRNLTPIFRDQVKANWQLARPNR